jgi:metal-dependent hydrolase (beta-lactamase superfamily II)
MQFPDLRRAGKLAQRLKAAGIDPASVTDVVLTHMYMDHCGGLLADGVKERLRPELRVHVAAAEAEFWESPDFSRVQSQDRQSARSQHSTDAACHCRRGDRITTVSAAAQIVCFWHKADIEDAPVDVHFWG